MYESGTATDYLDLLERLDTFLTATGSAYGRAAGAGNTGNGGFGATLKGGSASIAETWTVTLTSASAFTVVGSVSGAQGGTRTVGTAFVSDTPANRLAFTLTAGGVAFVAGDVFTFSTAPPWTSKLKARGCTVLASAGTSGQYAADNVVDGKVARDSGRHWQFLRAALPVTVEFTLAAAETVVEYAILGGQSYGPNAWTLEYHNGSTWVTLDTRSAVTSWADALIAYTVASPVSATRYRLNITAVNGAGTYGEVYAVELRRAPGGPNAAYSQYLWMAPGNDGTSEVYVGVHALRRTDVDYYDWEVLAFDGYTAGLNARQQPGKQGFLWMPLWNSSIPYWFVCDGRRVVVVAKVSTNYEACYLGLYDPFFTPAQLPYPICLGGSLAIPSSSFYWNSTLLKWSTVDDGHNLFPHSDRNYSTAYDVSAICYQMRLRSLAGAWIGAAAKAQGVRDWTPRASEAFLWPECGDFNLLDVNHDGGYALLPILMLAGEPNPMGQLSGVFAVTGQGAGAEDIVTVGGVAHLLVPNVNRTTRQDWLALRLD